MKGVTMRSMPTEQQIRDVFRESVRYVYEDDWGDYERDHEDRVVAEVQAFLRGEREKPWKHSHWYDEDTGESEHGYCVECDAGDVLELLDDDDSASDETQGTPGEGA